MIHDIPPKYAFGTENFAYWENFLTDDDLNFIEYHPTWSNFTKAYVGGQGSGHINEHIRKTQVSWLDLNQESLPIWEKITDTISEVNRRFFHFDLTGCYEPIQLGLYRAKDQGHYDWHTDSGITDNRVPRKLSMALLLSDPEDFEGGELQIKVSNDNPINLELKRGRAWFFSSNTLHRVTPVTKGIRKSAVLWIGGPQFR